MCRHSFYEGYHRERRVPKASGNLEPQPLSGPDEPPGPGGRLFPILRDPGLFAACRSCRRACGLETVRGRAERRRSGRHGRSLSAGLRSEEHTSELQSLMRISYAVFCLKKKNKQIAHMSK